MKLEANAARQATAVGDLGIKVDYTIDPRMVAHVMWMLRTGLYTRKALAVLREYTSNGWDAHREFGKADVPIEVHVPTWADPVFRCRDFGPGLPLEAPKGEASIRIFAEFGTSTKRGATQNCPDCAAVRAEADDGDETHDIFCKPCGEAEMRALSAVGALGIGSKAAGCIGDTFTVTSWHGGTKSIYSSAIGEDNKGSLTLMHQEPCGDETGVEIKVPAPQNLVYEFEREAKWLFRYMRPQPKCNVPLPPPPPGLKSGYIQRDQQSNWIGVMGCVPYRLDLDAMHESLVEAGIWEPLQKLGGAVYLPIGDVEFAINRESLQYTKTTIKALTARLKGLIKEYLDDALGSLKSGTGSGWERRRKALFLSGGLGFRLPKRYNDWTRANVALWDKDKGQTPKNFTMLSGKRAATHQVPINDETVLLLKAPDDERKMDGWQLRGHDMIIVPKDGCSMEDARSEVESLLLAANLDGVRIGLLTERAWYAPAKSRRSGRYHNAKHRQHTFEMTGFWTGDRALSNNWTKVEPPQEEHPYFIISSFKHRDGTGFYDVVQKDKALAKKLGLTDADNPFPAVYGYKTTQKRPVKDADIEQGTPYYQWRKEFFASQMTKRIKADIRTAAWAALFSNLPYQYRRHYNSKPFLRELPKLVEKLAEALGPKHKVVRYFAAYREARKARKRFHSGHLEVLQQLAQMYPSRNNRSAPECALDRLLAKYPMLRLKIEDDNDMHVFQTHADTLINYIQTIDRAQS